MQDDDVLPDEQAPDDVPAEETEQPEAEADEADADGSAETDEESEGDPQAAEGDSDDQEPPAQERRRLTGSERLQRKLERALAENAELRARVAPIGDVKAEVERIIGTPPKESDFNGDYTAYSTALSAYETDRRITTRQVQGQVARDQATQGERRQDLMEAHQDRLEEFLKVAPDYVEVVRNAKGPEPSPQLLEMILESDQSPGVSYYLAKNPRHFERLTTMNDRQAAREIGRIEAHLSQPSQRTQSRAPRPIRPLIGGAAPPDIDARINAWNRRRYGDR